MPNSWQDFDYSKWKEEDGKFDHEKFEVMSKDYLDKLFDESVDEEALPNFPQCPL